MPSDSRPLSRDSKYVVCDFVGAKVRRMFYIASDLLKTLRDFNNISPAIFISFLDIECEDSNTCVWSIRYKKTGSDFCECCQPFFPLVDVVLLSEHTRSVTHATRSSECSQNRRCDRCDDLNDKLCSFFLVHSKYRITVRHVNLSFRV